MKKSEVQAIYQEVKRNRVRNKMNRTNVKRQQGCQSCGQVTWKPNQQA
ncbi:MAG TPA: hypothetical protein VFK37_02390 [Bacillales bacterium]|nr:hypothetical protein [Bacillales bacterium]